MSYVVLQPRSNTNPSDSYRVVDYDKWNAYRQGETHHLPTVGDHKTYDEAKTHADSLNR